jgi:mannose-1-phosphate guanylyltransferase
MKAMVLAAGKGTRHFPLTGVLPIPMAPVAGKPVVQHIFDLMARVGVEEIHVNVHYLTNTILGLYGEETQVDGAKIHFTREERLTGTAGGVKRLASVGSFEETFMVIIGDALTDVDMRELVDCHKEKGASATLALKRVGDPSGYEVAEWDAEKNILRFQEKPEAQEAASNLANTGVYVLEPEVLDYIPEGAFFDFAKDVFPRLLESGEKTLGYDEGEWCGGGLWISEEARVHLSAYSLMEGYTFVDPNAVVGRGASLSGVVAVGSDCPGERRGDRKTERPLARLLGGKRGVPGGLHSRSRLRGPAAGVDPGRSLRTRGKLKRSNTPITITTRKETERKCGSEQTTIQPASPRRRSSCGGTSLT